MDSIRKTFETIQDHVAAASAQAAESIEITHATERITQAAKGSGRGGGA